ncbi:carbohydrate sulfotransferase 7 [Sebastes umbrosus]|uniref:carbohydrate sulfotransferase 7 n=1 Tax=Sebastes umbrosus TaxID=72105 RepID=UPI00189E64BB|nr:carbohydrate sulfotransferase 7 [Sebastes umbrosus]XP_037627007.1 carbohydrate sulfotransferase 7 [Sebastes umbrosus]XP_037627008.1 carbohydrate sulfotransferase 7 [Sebastes umbrosus]XP_037627009.1 carbohydrate sulfotransferase 7 [Sebastes umbrosus]XP_037627010.1 carbohydrate sulfotransferase 7 [Sebastes umbrosus]
MKRRLHKKYLLLILMYSGLLLLIPYVLDYRDKSGVRGNNLLQQQSRCPELQDAVAQLWDHHHQHHLHHVNGTEEEQQQHAVNRSRTRVNIYLHATWRTGSSFLGELFNQHPGVFYLYEPMWHIWQALYPGDAGSLQGAVRDMMSALYRCDFSVLKLYSGPNQNLTTAFMFGWKMNKVICSEPLCDAHLRHQVGLVREDLCAKCPKRDIRELERECMKYPVMVIKGVRVLDLSTLVPLMKDPEVNLQVIQLFRDPRAVHNSRLKSKQALVKESIQVLRSKKQTDKYKRLLVPSSRVNRAESYVSSAMELICENWLSDLLLVLNAPPWVRRSYMRVRYEDLVLRPLEELQRLFNFSNLSSFPDLDRFALNMTHGQGYSSDRPFLISSRDAKEAIYAWRERLSVEQIQQVEAYCSEVMRQLGYEKNQKNSPDKTS